MDINLRKHDLKTQHGNKEILIIDMEGYLDIQSIPKIKSEIKKSLENTYYCIINLKKMVLLDSCALGLIVSILRFVNNNNGILKLTNLSSDIKRIFHISRLDKVFDICNSEYEALEKIEKEIKKD